MTCFDWNEFLLQRVAESQLDDDVALRADRSYKQSISDIHALPMDATMAEVQLALDRANEAWWSRDQASADTDRKRALPEPRANIRTPRQSLQQSKTVRRQCRDTRR